MAVCGRYHVSRFETDITTGPIHYFFPLPIFANSLIFQTIVLILNLLLYDDIVHQLSTRWPIIVLLFASVVIVFAVTEICKWEELK